MDILAPFVHNELVSCYIQAAILKNKQGYFPERFLIATWMMAAAAGIHHYIPCFWVRPTCSVQGFKEAGAPDTSQTTGTQNQQCCSKMWGR